jgi:phospholipid/cholesterol/gamma-HCH transport system permease protein
MGGVISALAGLIIRALTGTGTFVQQSYIGKLSILGSTICLSVFRKQGNRKSSFATFISQTYFTGVEAIPQIALLAMIIGALTILQTVTVMPKLGGGDELGFVLVAVVIREMGPLMTALFVAGRTGSAMSTWIGNMKIMQEVDALRAMGVDPLHFLIMPAFFATIVSMFCLTMLFNLVAVFGGFFIVSGINIAMPGIFTTQLSFGLFMEKIFEAMGFIDIIFGVVKPIFFGIFISVIACFHGMAVGLDVREVPKATRMTVVRSLVAIIVCDMILAVPVFFQLKEKMIL